MKFSFKFTNLMGTIYRNGNLAFSPDGNSVISPVGNRITVYDLKNNKSRTLSVESRYNYTNIALSPDGSLLIAVNERGEAQLISMISCTVIHSHKFKSGVQCIVFSPDGAYFAVAQGNVVLIFCAPGEITGEYNPFVLKRHFIGGYDDVTWLDWSPDSSLLAIGCRDSSTKICAVKFFKNFRTTSLSGHTDAIVACFFEANSLHLNTVSRNGQLCLWECSLAPSDLTEKTRNENAEPQRKKKPPTTAAGSGNESEDDVDNVIEKTDTLAVPDDENEIKDESVRKAHPFFYKKLARHYLANEPRKEHRDALLTAANYNPRTKVMVVAFSTGAFYLYELPDVNMIHSLSISDYPISTALFNSTGDWLALASREIGQLLVWEWQSEQYIMKQQGHSSEMTCIAYSSDGQYIATGGEDSKVKLWNTQSSFCFVTFSEHTSGVTDVQFSRNKKFLVSSSLDGTVRAFDITRYRNFRTFTSPTPAQFASVALDYSGELVVAGGQDVYEIFLWSVKTGKLLEVISGHEGPVSSLAFSPSAISSTLVSGSWDKTVKIWNCLESNSEHESIDALADVTSVAFNPNGEEVAVATLSGNIIIFDVKSATQVNTIEGRYDLGSGRLETDIITAKKNAEANYFSTIEYSADGECLLAAGKSPNICIYHVREAILLKKFEITKNQSLDGLNEFISRKHMSDFGNMALIEQREELEGGKVAVRLPGVRKGDMSARRFQPEVRVFCVRFSPTGQAFAAAGTEGLCIYALDKGVVFDPFDLSLEVTPKATHEALNNREYTKALIMSLKLNDPNLIALVLERIPYKDIELICADLSNDFAHRLLQNLARMLQSSPHIEFYLQWCCCLLTSHGNRDSAFQNPALLALHESISRKYEMLNKICDFNKYTLRVLLDTARERENSNQTNGDKTAMDESDSDSEMLLIRTQDEGSLKLQFSDENEDDSDEDDVSENEDAN
ncbi:periodic tryptophan protein 2 homolog [Scaptodrosophila lebanonensis]|uniref:Periodic tryptophan protein 2 homolog n=1 Tax=Drosophila lebanonensis TaxID=7225 RepID=A0A6J2UJT3_DROLE|nr:periodic tryptophan protein 2 homolog [Scaptodrosophila lebanonensis]